MENINKQAQEIIYDDLTARERLLVEQAVSKIRKDITKRYIDKYPKESLRKIATVIGVSYETIRFYKSGIRQHKKKKIMGGEKDKYMPSYTLEDLRRLGRDIVMGRQKIV